MPELPEVETVLRGIEPYLLGKRILKANFRRPDLRWPFPEGIADALTGATATQLRRRSKYILVDFDMGQTLLIHLGMSGRIRIDAPDAPQDTARFVHDLPDLEKHDHVVFDLDGPARLRFNDPRRFGAMDLFATDKDDTHPLLRNIGPEPLGNGFHADHLWSAIKTRKAPIKTLLLDQSIVAGLGNIYVCEILFRTGIRPSRAGHRLTRKQVDSLVPATRAILSEAIASGGSTLRDHRQADGELGYFQHNFVVYGREGECCQTPNCAQTIKRIVQSGRSSFYCPNCQK